MRYFIFALVVLTALGCGKDKPGGSNPQSGGSEFLLSVKPGDVSDKSCADYHISGKYDGSKIEPARDMLRAQFKNTSTTACLTTGSTASCAIGASGGEFTITTTMHTFDPKLLGDLEAVCKQQNGTLTKK